jgi:TRAP-type C4-dicarboxylate transport system substrate-binding protein
MNMDTWNSLPDNLRQVMRDVAEQYYHELLNIHLEEMDKVAELVKKGEVKKSYLNADCEKKHQEAAYKLWDTIAERDAAAAKAIEMIKEWRKTLQ